MKSGRVGWFCVGVVVTLGAIGAVSYASAQGDATIKVCANKSSGVMRLLTKGTCRKNETSLSWNNLGPRGLAGEKGETGSAGPKGDTGAAGTKGDSGTNGQNLFAVDANGATIGPVRGFHSSNATVEVDGFLWALDMRKSNNFTSNLGEALYYSDSACTQPFIMLPLGYVSAPQLTAIDYGLNDVNDAADKAYRSTGDPLTFSGRSVYFNNNGLCSALTTLQKTGMDVTSRLVVASEIPKPRYEAPVKVVTK